MQEMINKDLEELKNKQTEMTNTITQMKTTLEGISSRINEVKERISDLEGRVVELLHNRIKQNTEKKRGRSKGPLGQHKRINTCIIGVPEEEREEGPEKIFKTL